jgi:hypothetical protein
MTGSSRRDSRCQYVIIARPASQKSLSSSISHTVVKWSGVQGWLVVLCLLLSRLVSSVDFSVSDFLSSSPIRRPVVRRRKNNVLLFSSSFPPLFPFCFVFYGTQWVGWQSRARPEGFTPKNNQKTGLFPPNILPGAAPASPKKES